MNTAPKLSEAIETLRKYRNNGSVRIWDMDAALDVVLAALAPPSGEGVDAYWIHAAAWNEIVLAMPLGDDQYSKGYSEALNAVTRNLCAPPRPAITPQSAPADGDAVQQALLVINDAANDARHRGDYARANALVLARVTLYRASTTQPPASQERGGELSVSRTLLAAVLSRDGGKSCHCISHSRYAEKEYEAGNCPHQQLAALLAASPPSSAAEGCNHQWVPDTEVEGVSYCAWCRVTRGDAAEQASPDDYEAPCQPTEQDDEQAKPDPCIECGADPGEPCYPNCCIHVAEQVQAGESREARMVVVERDNDGKPTVWCDPEIVDLVTALNAAGIRTVASCSGHGEQHGNIALADGRELLIAPSFEAAREMDGRVAGGVTDEMVLRALCSQYGVESANDISAFHPENVAMMRAALVAALSGGKNG